MRIRFAIALIVLSAGAVRAQESQTQHYAVYLDDVKVGRAEMTRTETDQRVTHAERLVMTLQRGPASVTIDYTSQTVETVEGDPLSFELEMSLGGGATIRRAGTIENGRIALTVTQMGQSSSSTAEYPQGALMPHGATLYQQAQGLDPGTEYRMTIFDPEGVRALTADVTVGGEETVPLIGRTARLHRIRSRQRLGLHAVTSISYVDGEFEMYKTSVGLGGVQLYLVACDEQFARGPNGQIDVLDVGAIDAPRAIARPRQVTEARFVLAMTDADGEPLNLPDTDSQAVTVGEDGQVIVRTRHAAPVALGPRGYDGDDPAVTAALQPSEYVQSAHPRMQATLREIIDEDDDAWSAARKIERWVSRHVEGKTLSVGYASALETLRSGQGDCSEHALLTAALCRAAGIPCRLAAGVAYAPQFAGREDVFIGHMWDQVYIDGRWVDLDAALGADALRITQAVGVGDDPTAMVGVLTSLGRFEIVELDVESRN